MVANVLTENLDRYIAELKAIQTQLQVPAHLLTNRRPVFIENQHIVKVGPDVYGRDCWLGKEAVRPWYEMQATAKKDGVTLNPISGFRSVRRQQEIIAKKLLTGQSLVGILSVNALPGYSQHHTGLAIDLAGEDQNGALSEIFEKSEAFRWLSENASRFNFALQYPRNNVHRFVYEPWHWALDSVHKFAVRR